MSVTDFAIALRIVLENMEEVEGFFDPDYGVDEGDKVMGVLLANGERIDINLTSSDEDM